MTDHPFEIEEIADLGIPLPSGHRLSARVWRPIGAGPVPAILEFLPYRKRDGTAERDALNHPYLAAHGYACVRVDMRGCGDSEGLFDDEYSEQETGDGVFVVNWLAEQPWCSGAVGMIGISWGGFNGLQIAARAPDPLKAVVSICSSADRFADDIHYKGGLMLGENPGWAATALSWFSVPPDPEIVGDGWRDTWLKRLENTPFLIKKWASHQTRDAYWKHGSVCEDYSTIKAAVLSVGGWHDGYRNTIARLMENLSSPVRGLIGPWNHKYPNIGMPGPQIDFLGEVVRWFDHWLKGEDRGVNQDPTLRAYIMESLPPKTAYAHRPGRWVGVDWPLSTPPLQMHLAGLTLAPDPAPVGRTIDTRLECGQGAGEFFPFGFGPGELPDDQRADDGLSTRFDSAPLSEAVDLLGAPRVTLRLAANSTRGQIAVRLCDLRPDGTSALVAHGFLNLRHRNGHDRSDPISPGEVMEVALSLDHCGYAIPAGHRLRLAISASYWPFVFPEGEDVTLVVEGGTLSLPVMTEGDEVSFGPPRMAAPMPIRVVTVPQEAKTTTRDHATGEIRLAITGDDGVVEHLPTGLVIGRKVEEVFTITPGDPASARAEFTWHRTLGRGDWQVSTVARVAMEGLSDRFAMTMHLSAEEDGEQVFSREWQAEVPRA